MMVDLRIVHEQDDILVIVFRLLHEPKQHLSDEVLKEGGVNASFDQLRSDQFILTDGTE